MDDDKEEAALEEIRQAVRKGMTMTFPLSPDTKVIIKSTDEDEAVFIAQVLWMNANLTGSDQDVLRAIELYAMFLSLRGVDLRPLIERMQRYADETN